MSLMTMLLLVAVWLGAFGLGVIINQIDPPGAP